jgi:hypothetical protein
LGDALVCRNQHRAFLVPTAHELEE